MWHFFIFGDKLPCIKSKTHMIWLHINKRDWISEGRRKWSRGTARTKRNATRLSWAWVSCETSRGHFLTNIQPELNVTFSRSDANTNMATSWPQLPSPVGALSRRTKESVDGTMASSLAHTWPYNPNTVASLTLLADTPTVNKYSSRRWKQ